MLGHSQHDFSPHVTRYLILIAWLVVTWASGSPEAQADHALEFHPSCYPHEIRIEAADPARAAERFSTNAIHAYIGGDPLAAQDAPGNLDGLRIANEAKARWETLRNSYTAILIAPDVGEDFVSPQVKMI